MAIPIVLILALSRSAAAQTNDLARGAARELATQGVEELQAGKVESASQKLERAYKVVRAPSVGLWSARALVKVNKWVEAAERYLEVTRLDPNTGDVSLQKQSQLDATKERDELLTKLPAFTLQLSGATDDVELEMDGVAVPSALVGARINANPGPHLIKARDHGREAQTKVTAVEGQAVSVSLDLGGANTRVAASEAGSAAPAASASTPAPAHETEAPAGRRVTPAVWIAFGAGGVGLVVGATTGLMAMSKKSDISPGCVDNRCPSAARDQVDSYNMLRSVSTVGFIVGGVGLAAGGVLLIAAPKPLKRAGLVPWVGPSSAGINGSF